MGKAIDLYISKGDITGLARLLLLMLFIYLLTALLTWSQSYIMIAVSQKTLKKIRENLFDKIQTLSLRFFDRRPHGELMSRFTNDIENITYPKGYVEINRR